MKRATKMKVKPGDCSVDRQRARKSHHAHQRAPNSRNDKAPPHEFLPAVRLARFGHHWPSICQSFIINMLRFHYQYGKISLSICQGYTIDTTKFHYQFDMVSVSICHGFTINRAIFHDQYGKVPLSIWLCFTINLPRFYYQFAKVSLLL